MELMTATPGYSVLDMVAYLAVVSGVLVVLVGLGYAFWPRHDDR